MIWRYCSAVLSAAAICLLVAGCGSVQRTHFYTFGEAGAVVFTGSDTTKPLIRVERLTIAEPYSDRRIVYRPSPNEVSFWEYHRWAAPPGRMLTARVAERMAESGLFRGVDCFPYSWANADLVLRGTVLAFEEIDKGGDWYAHIKMFLELTSPKAGRSTLWSSKIDIERKADSRHPEAVVVAMSEVLDEAITRAEEGIAATLR